jgi:hypothetical protein
VENLFTAPASAAQLRYAARKGVSSEPSVLRHPVEDIDFSFLNDDCSIPDILRVLQ